MNLWLCVQADVQGKKCASALLCVWFSYSSAHTSDTLPVCVESRGW